MMKRLYFPFLLVVAIAVGVWVRLDDASFLSMWANSITWLLVGLHLGGKA